MPTYNNNNMPPKRHREILSYNISDILIRVII